MDEAPGAEVETGSPTGTDVAPPAPTPPGAQPGTAPAEKLTPFHQHPDWQRMIRSRDEATQRATQVEQRAAQLEQRLRQLEGQQPKGPSRTPEEQAQRSAAVAALRDLLSEDPELKDLPQVMKLLPSIIQRLQGVDGLQKAQQQSLYTASLREIEANAKAAGLSADKTHVAYYEDVVSGIIARDPEMLARFQAGDTAVVAEAFKQWNEGFVAGVRRTSNAQLVDTKTKVRQLPPRPAGSAAGPAAPAKLEPGKEREYERGMYREMRDTLKGLLSG